MTIAVGVNIDSRREVLGMAIGASEAEQFWAEFLRDLVRCCLAGVKLMISDAHERIKAAKTQMRPKLPRRAMLMDKAEVDVLAHMTFPAQNREITPRRSYRTLERRDQAPG